jgi:putative GTP pyrophosphokinase
MTKDKLSKTQVDRLGDRLRKGDITEADLRLLDSYRLSFAEAYEQVAERVRAELRVALTGRPAKSTSSVAEKLRRESIRLSQIQDIAGCRIIVADLAEQESVVADLKRLFDLVTIVDRRLQPSHGYRAVHVVIRQGGKLVEIQVRTALQHLWAEQSEKASDVVDPMIKYGGGDAMIQDLLRVSSDGVAHLESLESKIAADQAVVKHLLSHAQTQDELSEIAALQNAMNESQKKVLELRGDTFELLQSTIDMFDEREEHDNDISN